MRVRPRVVALAALTVAALAAPLPARVDVPTPQVQVEAKIVEVSDKAARELGVFWRTGADGKPDLLLSLPVAVGGKPVDGAEVKLGPGAARDFQPSLLPPGWKLEARKDLLSFSGPALADRKSLAIALDAAAGMRLVVAPRVQLESNGAIVLDLRPEIRQLNRVQKITDVGSVVRLPQAFSPGDALWFTPLDPKFTPGGGSWKIGGLDAVWDGAYDRPGYSLQIPPNFSVGARPLEVSFVDLWGTRLVDGKATDLLIFQRPTVVGGPTNGGGPVVTGCSPGTVAGDSFCVCGNFPAGAAAELTINGQPIGEYLTSSSPSVLDFSLPADFPAGALRLGAARGSGFDIADKVRGVLIRVGGEIDRDKLRRGESTSLKLWLEGTSKPIDLRLRNRSPGIVAVEGGVDQKVTTTGGKPNQVARTVNAVSPGDFTISYSLEVGSCPCAEESDTEEETVDRRDDPEYDDYGDYPQYDVGDDYPELVDWWTVRTWEKKLGEWLERTKDLTVRDKASDDIADQIQREVEALDKFLDEIRPRIEQYRREARNYAKYEFQYPKSQIALYEKLQKIVSQLVFLDGRLTLLPRGGKGSSQARDACSDRLRDCDQLRQKAEAAEAEARRLRAEAEQASRPAKQYKSEVRQLSVLRRQAAAYRELEQSALARMAKSAERAKANPGKGYEKDIASAQRDAAGYAADAVKLEAQAKALELQEARDSVMADYFRKVAEQAERAAVAAEEAARAARSAYQACLDAAIEECPKTPAKGGAGASTQEKPPTPVKPEPPQEPKNEKPTTPGQEVPKIPGPPPTPSDEWIEMERHPLPRRCGPDVTPAFEGALASIARRVAALPPSELGPEAGKKFIERNWPDYWHETWQSDAPIDDNSAGHWDWDDLIWWSNETWSETCNNCLQCEETNWLWGRCLASDFISHLFEDFVWEKFHASYQLKLSGLGELAAGATVPGDSCQEIAKALAGVPEPKAPGAAAAANWGDQAQALREAFRAAFAKLGTETESWWGASCEKCDDYTLSQFRDDWSDENWWLSNGSVQHPDGSIEKKMSQLLQEGLQKLPE